MGCQQAILAGGNYGGIFLEIERNCLPAMLAGGNYGGVFLEIGGEGLRGLPKSNIGGRKLCGNFSRNWGEIVCVDFQKAILAGGNYGGIFLEIGRNCLPGFPTSNTGGRKLWGNFLEIWGGFAWVAKK